MDEDNLNVSLSISQVAVSSLASLATGTYVGFSHGAGKDASLLGPVITIGIDALVSRNEANPSRNNPGAQESGKNMMTVAGVISGVVLNAVGYAAGYGIGYVFRS